MRKTTKQKKITYVKLVIFTVNVDASKTSQYGNDAIVEIHCVSGWAIG